jgi:nucleoside-diphosphate-sugar epimerase
LEQKKIAIVGFGDLGERLSAALAPQRWRVLGLRRRAHAVPAGVESHAIDLRDPQSLGVLQALAPDALMIALTPAQRSADGYREGFADAMTTIVKGLGGCRPERAFFISSTRVYREDAGGWVDEDSPLDLEDPYARAIIDAEQRLLDALPGAVVLRAGGLYGHGPGPLLKRVAAGKHTPVQPERFSNRIHRDDVAGFICYALETPLTERVYNLVDDDPAPIQEVEAWLCGQLGQPYEPPPGTGPDDAGHKRIANARLRNSGYRLAYPDYRAGYAAVLHRWMAHSEREDSLDLH